MYAHVTNGTVDSLGQPPELVYEDGRWWDLRTLDPTLLATVDWYLVNETTRPTDTATHTFSVQYTLNGNVVNQTWTSTPKSTEQLANEASAATENTIRQLLNDTMPTLDAITATTNANMTGNTAAAAIKDEARAIRRLIRLAIEKLDGTN